MKFIPNSVTRTLSSTLLKSQKHSPTILFAAGIIGVGGTVVLACRSTLKLEGVLADTQATIEDAKKALREHPGKYSDADYKKDMTYIYVQSAVSIAKLYAPAFILGVTSIACLAGSHNILSKRNASLTAAYAAIDKSFKQYRNNVREELGEDKDREFLFGTTDAEKVDAKGEPTGKTEKVLNNVKHSPYARIFDETCQSWSKDHRDNMIFIRAQQNYANDLLVSRGHVFLNDVYDALGFPRTSAGQLVGWVYDPEHNIDGDNYIDFGIYEEPNRESRRFVNAIENSVWLDFNVDGVVYDKI